MKGPTLRIGLACAAALVASLGSAGVALAAWSTDPGINTPVCVTGFGAQNIAACSDGAGGELIAWSDFRSGGIGRTYVQHVLADGTLAPGWPVNGVQLTSVVIRDQEYPALCSDGAGGAIVTWEETYNSTDHDIFAQRITSTGTLSWTTAGVWVCAATKFQLLPSIATDGAGGAFIAWMDNRGANYDIYAQHLGPGGAVVSGWVPDGSPVCSVAGDQTTVAVAADGTGGVLLAWLDTRYVDYATFAQRMTSAGAVASGWTANGNLITHPLAQLAPPTLVANKLGGPLIAWTDYRAGVSDPNVYASVLDGTGYSVGTLGGGAVCTRSDAQSYYVSMAPDGIGGAFVVWSNGFGASSDISAEHVTGSGTIAAGWPSASYGLDICLANGGQDSPVVVSDGVGGAIFAWVDGRSFPDVYALRVDANGLVVHGWQYYGNPVCTADWQQGSIAIVSDGRSGALLSWLDNRTYSFGYRDVYTQRIDAWGVLGDGSPKLAGVRDVPLDQGGQVKVAWNASYLDADPTYGITDYRLWRSVPPALAARAAQLGRGVTASADEAASTGRLLVTPEAALGYAWEYVATQPAGSLPSYALVAPTTSDSLGAGNPRTAFMVEARSSTTVGWPHWFSAPDSGYSVDNLPPALPAPFTGSYAAGSARLSWGRNTEPDFANYRLYRGGSASFVPGPSNLVVTQPDTGYIDPAGSPYFYKLAAVDAHGNVSPYALLLPSGTTGVDEGQHLALALAGARPNPSSGRELRVGFVLPRAGGARLELVDVAGRAVRSLETGGLEAGEHVVDLAAGVPIPPGIYLLRLAQGGQERRARVVVLR